MPNKISHTVKNTISNFMCVHSSMTIILFSLFVFSANAIILYFIIPILLNYPKGFAENDVAHRELLGTTYIQTCILIFFFIAAVSSTILTVFLKGIDHLTIELRQHITHTDISFTKLRKRCMTIPYSVYMWIIGLHIMGLVVDAIVVAHSHTLSILGVLKTSILFFSIDILATIFIFIFARSVFLPILLSSYQGNPPEGFRLGLRYKIALQTLPLFIVSILFTSLIGYSKLIEEKGDVLSVLFKIELAEVHISNEKYSDAESIYRSIRSAIKVTEIPFVPFFITPDGEINTENNRSFTKMMQVYLKYLSKNNDNRIYDSHSILQGVFTTRTGPGGTWKIGVTFEVASVGLFKYFIISFILLLLTSAFVVYYFSRSLARDILIVADSLRDLAESEQIDLSKRIPVTSNDEISDLVMAFNKVQEREKQQVEIITQQERLASLGQLVGSMAHNLRSPLMAISGSIVQVANLVDEYGKSIGNANVTNDDHHEIAKEMANTLVPMRNYCSYMSDVITAVKNQAGEQSSQGKGTFTVEQVLNTVTILMQSELQEHQCRFVVHCSTDKNLMMNGNITSLIQIINNLISNAIDAYEGKSGLVELNVERQGSMIVFMVTDHGNGIPEHIKENLFKKMTTTKGTKGNGLGLYVSFSTVKGVFGGDMHFVSEPDRGTSFYIEVPVAKPADA